MSWIIQAQERWTPDGWQDYAMTAMAFDPAGGGADRAELMSRHGTWFGEPVSEEGPQTADADFMVGKVFAMRRDGCPIIIDVGGGYGGAPMLRMADNGVAAVRFNGAARTTAVTKDGSKLRFVNKRSEALWRVREALDPNQDGGSTVALPPHPEVRSDLAAPTYEVGLSGIQVESKDDVRARIGRSTGKGDCIQMLICESHAAVRRQKQTKDRLPSYSNTGHALVKRHYGR